MSDVVVELVGDFFAWAIMDRIRLRRARRRLERDDRVDCAFRALTGRVFGIGTDWSHGNGTLRPGSIHFVPKTGVVGDRDVTVLSADGTRARRPSRQEAWSSVDPDCAVWRLETPQGELEWAVHVKLIDAAATRLATTQPGSRA